MPCYTRRTVNVDLSQASNVEALVDALTKLGARLHAKTENSIVGVDENGRALSWRKGTGLVVDAASEIANAIAVRKAYGYAVVKRNATRFGWRVAETKTGALELSRR